MKLQEVTTQRPQMRYCLYISPATSGPVVNHLVNRRHSAKWLRIGPRRSSFCAGVSDGRCHLCRLTFCRVGRKRIDSTVNHMKFLMPLESRKKCGLLGKNRVPPRHRLFCPHVTRGRWGFGSWPAFALSNSSRRRACSDSEWNEAGLQN